MPGPTFTDPSQAALDNLNATVSAAPELKTAPAAALDTATAGGDVAGSAQVVAQSGNRQVAAAAADKVNANSGGGLLGHLAHYAGDAVGDLAKAANAPLQAVQHEYRYLHDVEARHGLLAALGEGALITGVIAGGIALTGGLGDAALIGAAGEDAAAAETAASAAGMVGEAGTQGALEGVGETAAEGAETGGQSALRSGFQKALNANGGRAALINLPVGQAVGNLAYRDSWQRTANGSTYVDPNTGQKVSFGRDIAGGFMHLIGHKDAGSAYSTISGVSDALGDIFGDPVQAAGAQIGVARRLEGGATILGQKSGRILTLDNFENKIARGDSATQRALEFFASHGAADIQNQYRDLAPIVYDKTVAADSDAQGALTQIEAQLADHRQQLDFYQKVIKETNAVSLAKEAPFGAEDLPEMSDDVRNHLENREAFPTLSAARAGHANSITAHLADLRENVIPDLRSAIEDAQERRAAIPKVTLKGLDSASTADEAADVIRRRAIIGNESIGSAIPSRTIVKSGMAKVRNFMANQDANQMHRIRGLFGPRTALGTLSRLTERIPGELDRATFEYKSSFSLARLERMNNLTQWLKAGLGQDAAHSVVDMMTHADLAGRQTILRNAALNNILGAAGMVTRPDLLDPEGVEAGLEEITDEKSRKALADLIDGMWAPSHPEAGAVFGTTRTGEAPLPLLSTDGHEVAGALHLAQAVDDVNLPSITDVLQMGKTLKYGHDYLGASDNWLFKHLTSWMKPAMLFSGGYPVHMAGAELALLLNKLGVRAMVHGAYFAAAAKLGYKAREDELGPMMDFVWRHLPESTKNAKSYEYMMEYAIQTEGHMVSEGTSAGTFARDSVGHRQDGFRHILGSRYELGSEFDETGKRVTEGRIPVGEKPADYAGMQDKRFVPEWQSQIRQLGRSNMDKAAAQAALAAHRSGEDVVAATTKAYRDELDKLSPSELSGMERAKLKTKGSPGFKTPLDDWADAGAENLLALTHDPVQTAARRAGQTVSLAGRAGVDTSAVAHEATPKLLQHIVDGTVPSKDDLQAIPLEHHPMSVPGRQFVPSSASWFERTAEVGFEKVMAPIINAMSRIPMSATEYLRRRGLLEDSVAKGLLSPEQAATKAAADTAIDSVKFIHNPADRTQLDVMLRNWAPFFFAQNQAYRRAARLFFENPGAFRRYQLEIMGAHNLTSQMESSDGNRYVAMPGAGFLTNPLLGAMNAMGIKTTSINPTGFGGTLASANVVFPASQGFRPDISPVVVMAAKAVNNFVNATGNDYASFSPVADKVNGTLNAVLGEENMDSSFIDQIVPNSTLNHILSAAGGSDVSFNSAYLYTLASLDYQQRVAEAKWIEGGRKGPPPTIAPPDGANAQEKQAFLQKVKNQTRAVFFMKAIIGAVSPIGAEVTVNDFGLTQKLQDDINSQGSISAGYTKFLQENPYATGFATSHSTATQGVALQETTEAQDWVTGHLDQIKTNPAYLWLMPQMTDKKYNPTVYNEQIADGLRTRDTPQQFLDALYTTAGDSVYYNALTIHQAAVAAAGKNSTALNQEYAKWDAYLGQLQKTMPTWWENFSSGQKADDAVESIQQLQKIYAKNEQPPGPQSEEVGQLLTQFGVANAAYVAAGQSSDYSSAQKTVRDNWQTWVTSVAADHPNLEPIINGIFRDALTANNPT